MDNIEVSVLFRLFFDDPYWVGLFERRIKHKVSYCRVVFGAEPSNPEVLDFIISRYHTLNYSPAVDNGRPERPGRVNPKRRQRMIAKSLEQIGHSTNSQKALQLQREESKLEKRKNLRQMSEEESKRKFELKQARKKEKKRGH